MVVKIESDKTGTFSNKFKQKFEECINGIDIEIFKDWHVSVYHYPQTQEQYFTNEYFSGRFHIYDEKGVERGRFNIGCFPHCCGVYTITGDYGDFCRTYYNFSKEIFEKNQCFTLLLACYISQHFNIPNLLAVDKKNSLNYKTYQSCNWNEMGECKGKLGSILIYFSKQIKEGNFLEEIKKLYESDIEQQRKLEEEKLQNTNKKQASKP